MITTTLFGGIGNQMFLYAATKALALRNHTNFAFNTSLGFVTDKLYRRKFELCHLNVKCPEAHAATFNVPFGQLWRKISEWVGRNVLLPQYRMVRDCRVNRHFELVTEPTNNVYLYGYWQSEYHFKDFEQEMRNDFRIMTPMPQRTLQELKEIEALGSNTVLLGVRRYQECPDSSKLAFEILGRDYYERAIAEVKRCVDNPIFVVFCQDMDWAKENIRISDAPVHYVRPKDGPLATIEDLYLMVHLRHAIISNSSYYWWGAWLQDTNKDEHVVIAPNNFPNPRAVCEDWTKIPAVEE